MEKDFSWGGFFQNLLWGFEQGGGSEFMSIGNFVAWIIGAFLNAF